MNVFSLMGVWLGATIIAVLLLGIGYYAGQRTIYEGYDIKSDIQDVAKSIQPTKH